MVDTKALPNPEKNEDELKGSEAPLLDHLIELRKRLIYSVIAIMVFFIACFAFAQPLYNILTLPFVWAAGGVENVHMITTSPQEQFFTNIKLAAFGAIILAFPIIAWQLYRFVAPGLYKKERNAFLPFHPGAVKYYKEKGITIPSKLVGS